MATPMTEPLTNQELLRLMTWMSPAFPIGAFSYSHGLEQGVEDQLITDRNDLYDWLYDLLTMGSLWNDTLVFAESWRAARHGSSLDELACLVEAMASTAERHLETINQGKAFVDAAKAWPHPILDQLPDQCALPVAAGALSAAHSINLGSATTAYAQAIIANLVQASLRLLSLGQHDGVALMAALENTISATATRASCATLDDLGSATVLAEIASMRHETQYSRLFRS